MVREDAAARRELVRGAGPPAAAAGVKQVQVAASWASPTLWP